jgi:hypothetical protein
MISQSSTLSHLCINRRNLPLFAPTLGRHKSYFLRAAATAISIQRMHSLDGTFESFMAATLDFTHDFSSDVAESRYSNALQQIRLGIKQGG